VVEADDARRVLQTKKTIGSAAFCALEAQFKAWYAWTVDLPGNFFLEVVDKLYKRNELANGGFAALGRGIDLRTIRVPVFLLAAQDDELISPPQLFAAERLVGTAPGKLRKLVVPGRHVGLFMGKAVLEEVWPKIIQFITQSEQSADLGSQNDVAYRKSALCV
jgi:poly(3-hydroxybutyrate) depolymerase